MPATVNVDGARSFQEMNTATQVRFFDQALFMAGSAAGLGGMPRSGVIPSVYNAGFASTPLDLYVQAQVSPNMTVNVLAGSAFIGRSGYGGYLAYNTAPRTLTVATASTTLPRVDLVYLVILDEALSDTGAPTLGGYAQLVIATGTPASSPVAPTLPANAIPLATINVAANATSIGQSNITDARRGTALAGSIRALLAGDSLSDPGYSYAELRKRYHATYGPLVDYWGIDSAWHGLTAPPQVPTSSYPLPDGNSMPGAAIYILAQTTVADPNWSYYPILTGQGSTTADAHTGTQAIRVRLDNASTGTILTTGGMVVQGSVGYGVIPGFQYGTKLSGNHTFYLTYEPVAAAAASFQKAVTYLNVGLLPA